ncbi:hypothetical protein Tco_0036837, partial [Tanacetum coccineum]
HESPAKEQPLPPIDSPTAESPGYVTESDPEEDPEEYKDDETEDGPVDYPMDGGDDGDDDDGDSSREDANDEDEDEEDEEEEEHLAPADSTTAIPIDEPVFPPEGTEPVFPPEGTEPVVPPPSTDITIGARITPDFHIPSTRGRGERLARCTAPHAHSPPLPPSSGCLTQIQTLRIERITKTKRSKKTIKNRQETGKKERDKNKSEESAKDQSRISPTQKERKSKTPIIKSRAKSDKFSKFEGLL